MKAKELAELLLTVPDWDVYVYVYEEGYGASPAVVSNMNVIDPRCKHGHVTLVPPRRTRKEVRYDVV